MHITQQTKQEKGIAIWEFEVMTSNMNATLFYPGDEEQGKCTIKGRLRAVVGVFRIRRIRSPSVVRREHHD